MSLRSYTVYLQGGGTFTLRATRYERSSSAVTFYNADGEVIPELFIEPDAVIAIVPSMETREGAFPAVR